MDKPPLDYRSIGPGGEGSFKENIPANTSFGELGRKRKLKRKVTGSKVLKARLNNSLNRSHGRLIKKIKNRSFNASFTSKTLRSNNQALARKLQQTLQELQLTQQKYCDLQREVQDLRIQNIQLQQQNATVSQEEVEAEVMRRVKETNREIQQGLNELSLSMMHPVQLLERVIRLCAGDRRASSLATGRQSSYGRGSSGSHASRISAGRNSGSASDSFTEGNKEQPQVINRLTGRLPSMNQSRPSSEETAAASRQSAPLANLSVIEEQSFIEDIPFTNTKCSGRPALETVPEDDDGKAHGRSSRRTAGLLELPEALKGNNRRTSMKALRVPVSKSLAETDVTENQSDAGSQISSEAHHNKEDSAAIEKDDVIKSHGDKEMDADVDDLQSKDDEQVMDAEPAWDDAQIPDDLMHEPIEEKKVRKKKLTRKERMRMHGGGDASADVDEDVSTEFPDETREKKRKGKAKKKKEKTESQDEDVYKDPLDDVMADTEDVDDVEEGNKRKSAAKVSQESEGRRRTKRLTVSLDKKKSIGSEEIIAESDKTATSCQPEGSEIIEQHVDNLVTNDMITQDQEKKVKTKKKDSNKGIGRGKRNSRISRSTLGITDTAEFGVNKEVSDVEVDLDQFVQEAPRGKDKETSTAGIKRKTARSRRGTFVKEQNGQEDDGPAAAVLEVNTKNEKQLAGGARRKSTRTRRGTFLVEETGTSKNMLDIQSEDHLKPSDAVRAVSTECISTKEKEKLKSNSDKTIGSRSRRGTYVMSKPTQELDNGKEQAKEEREHVEENISQGSTHRVNSSQGTYVLKQPNDNKTPPIALSEITDNVTQNTNSSPVKKACAGDHVNMETQPSALDSTCLDTLDMEMTEVVNYSAFDVQAMMEKLRKTEKDSKDASKETKVSKEDQQKSKDAEAGDGKKQAENKKTKLDVDEGKDSKEKGEKGKDKASLKSTDKLAAAQKSQSKTSSTTTNGVSKAPKGRIPVPTRTLSSDEEPAGGAAKFSVFSSKPGRLVFTVGRPDLAQMMNKKTKVKSTLPRPVSRSKQRTKTAEVPIMLQSPETGPKGVFQFIGTPPGGAAEGQKNVYDLSMNESAVQPNVREFKKRCSMVVDGVLTEEQPAVVEQETLTMPDSEELSESPHGIMLVLGNGRRTKPRARSKQVSYAEKLAQTKLTTPAQTPQVTIAPEGAPDVSGTPTKPVVTVTEDAPGVNAETPVMDTGDNPEENKDDEVTTEVRSPTAAAEKKKRKERPWEGKEKEAVNSEEKLEAPAEKKKRKEKPRETAEDVEAQEEVAEASEDRKKQKDKSLGAKEKEPMDHEKRCEVPAEKKKKREKSRETTEAVETHEEPSDAAEEKTKRKEKQQEIKAKGNVNHDDICEAPVEKKKKKEKAKESTGDLVKPSEDQSVTSKDKKHTKGKGKRKTVSNVKVVVEAAQEDGHDQVDMEEAPPGSKNLSPIPKSHVNQQLSSASVEKDRGKTSTDNLSEPQSALEEDQPRRRRRGAVISYKEPKLGAKLRRGDPGTTSIYNKDDNSKKRKSGRDDS